MDDTRQGKRHKLRLAKTISPLDLISDKAKLQLNAERAITERHFHKTKVLLEQFVNAMIIARELLENPRPGEFDWDERKNLWLEEVGRSDEDIPQ